MNGTLKLTTAMVAILLGLGRGLPAEEPDVATALRWLAAQQNDDGSWSFERPKTDGTADSADRATLKNARNGETGLALLAFLGHGYTHTDGQYKTTVKNGLSFLVGSMKVASRCSHAAPRRVVPERTSRVR